MMARLRLLIVPMIVLVLWSVTAILANNPAYPGPLESAAGLVEALGQSAVRESLLDTLGVTVAAFAIAAVAGTLLGSLFGTVPVLGAAGGALLYLFNSIPKLVLFPVFLLLLGLTTQSKLAFGVFHGLFVIAIVVMEAARGLDPLYLKLPRALGMSTGQRLRHVTIPALAPYAAVGVRLCFAHAFLGVIVAELLMGHGGLGGQIMLRVETFKIEQTVGLVGLTFLIALVPTLLIQSLEGKVRARVQPH